MRVSSVQNNNSNFNGLLTVRNQQIRRTKVFKTTPENDVLLRKLYKKVHSPSEKNIEALIANVENYTDAIFNITRDDFVKELPNLKKENFIQNDSQIFVKSPYISFIMGDHYTNIETAEFEISHDLRK